MEMKQKKVMEFLSELDESDTLWMWNNTTDAGQEDFIYEMAQFNDVMEGCSPIDIVESIELGHFDTDDDYFLCTIYGYESFSDIYEVADDSVLAEYIIDNDEDFGFDELRELLDADEEED